MLPRDLCDWLLLKKLAVYKTNCRVSVGTREEDGGLPEPSERSKEKVSHGGSGLWDELKDP